MPWKVKKLRRIGPFWLPSREPVEHVDLRRSVPRVHRPLFGGGTDEAAGDRPRADEPSDDRGLPAGR